MECGNCNRTEAISTNDNVVVLDSDNSTTHWKFLLELRINLEERSYRDGKRDNRLTRHEDLKNESEDRFSVLVLLDRVFTWN